MACYLQTHCSSQFHIQYPKFEFCDTTYCFLFTPHAGIFLDPIIQLFTNLSLNKSRFPDSFQIISFNDVLKLCCNLLQSTESTHHDVYDFLESHRQIFSSTIPQFALSWISENSIEKIKDIMKHSPLKSLIRSKFEQYCSSIENLNENWLKNYSIPS
jgi:hypothetical protein